MWCIEISLLFTVFFKVHFLGFWSRRVFFLDLSELVVEAYSLCMAFFAAIETVEHWTGRFSGCPILPQIQQYSEFSSGDLRLSSSCDWLVSSSSFLHGDWSISWQTSLVGMGTDFWLHSSFIDISLDCLLWGSLCVLSWHRWTSLMKDKWFWPFYPFLSPHQADIIYG